MSQLEPYLHVPEEYGEQAYPLKEHETRIGTSERNRIRVAAALGAEPEHARVVRKSATTYILAPVERSATIWLYRAGERRPSLIHGPTVISVGDAFSLVTPEGIRFELQMREVHRPKPKAGKDAGPAGMLPGKNMPEKVQRTWGRFAQELSRRAYMLVLSSWGGQTLQRAWFFVKTGQFLSPVYIVGFLIAVSGWGASIVSCRQSGQAQQVADTAKLDLQTCESALNTCEQSSSDVQTSFPELVNAILGDATWEPSLDWPALQRATRDEVTRLVEADRSMDGDGIRQDWFVGKRATYPRLVDRLVTAGTDPAVARLLSWTAVHPLEHQRLIGAKEEWRVRGTGDDIDRHCVRGPFELSYRQATAMNLTAADDAFFGTKGSGASARGNLDMIIDTFDLRRELLGLDPLGTPPPLSQDSNLGGGSDQACVFRTDIQDGRANIGRAAQALHSRFHQAMDLPGPAQNHWLTARLVKLFSFDLTPSSRQSLVAGATPQAMLAPLAEQDPEGLSYVITETARTLGRAIAVRCDIAMSYEPSSLPKPFDAPPPSFEACAILHARLERQRW